MSALATFNADALRTMMRAHLRATLARHFGGDLAQGRHALQLSRTYIEDQLALLKEEIASLLEQKRELILPDGFEAVEEVVALAFSQVFRPLLDAVVGWLQTATSDVLVRDGGEGESRAAFVGM